MIPERCPPAKHLRIAVPCLTGEIKATTTRSLIEATSALTLCGIPWSYDYEPLCPYLDHVRNVLATRFWDSDATDLLFIDSDVDFHYTHVVRIARLTRPFVGAIYPKKQDSREWPVEPVTGGEPDEDGLLERDMIPTGFMRLNRAVLAALPHEPYLYNPVMRTHFLGWFRAGAWDGTFHGEDPYLCYEWKRLGGKIHIMPDVQFGHTGLKTWRGNYGEFLRDAAANDKSGDARTPLAAD